MGTSTAVQGTTGSIPKSHWAEQKQGLSVLEGKSQARNWIEANLRLRTQCTCSLSVSYFLHLHETINEPHLSLRFLSQTRPRRPVASL